MQELQITTNRCESSIGNKTKRLTVDVPAPIHKALKIKAVTNGMTMAEIVRQLLMQQLSQNHN
jgi:predicted DNA binding CopG/RHH family protein